MRSIDRELARLFAPRHLQQPVDWAAEHCILRDNVSELPGSLRVYPFARDPLNSIVDPEVHKISLCWGSQSSKTTTMYAGLAYLLSEFPKDALWIMPSAENARNFSRNRWLPFVEDCRPLREQCPISAASGKIDSDRITNMRQEFLNCVLTFAGAGSENNVKSAPVAYLILDEIDEIDPDIRLAALERIKGRREYKIIQTSTPKEETSGIWLEYLQGDQRRYEIPCPHCGEHIELLWRQNRGHKEPMRYGIAFDPDAKLDDGEYDFERVAETAHYRCQRCDGEIYDGDKVGALKEGRWVAHNPKAPPGHTSYHLSSLYSPQLTFAWLIISWLQASNNTSGLRKFIQGQLAEPWREDYEIGQDQDPKALEIDYERGELKGQIRIIAADTQTDHYRYVVRGFELDGSSYLLDYGYAPTFGDLDEKFAAMACHKGIIDAAGDRTTEVYEEIFRRRGSWFGSRGWASMSEPYKLQHKDPFTGDNRGGKRRGKILYLHLDKSVWESEVAMLRSQQISGFHCFRDTPDDYYRELFACYWVRQTDKHGHIRTVKKLRRHRQDHYFDCECMARALSKFLGVARADIPAAETEPRKKKTPQSRGGRSAADFWR